MSPEFDRFYTVKEIADLLRVSEKQVRDYIAEGFLQSVKLKNRHRISQRHLDTFIEKNLTFKGENEND